MTRCAKKIIFLCALSFLIVTSASLNSLAETSDIVIEMIPNVPMPNTQTTFVARSYSFDANQAHFTWFLNGNKALEGIGKTEFSFTSREAGSRMTIRVTARTPSGSVFERTVVLSIADIDLLWEASTYAPVWYKGKALATPGALIKIFALPDFRIGERIINSSNIIYNWSLNDSPLYEKSGAGKNIFYLRANQFMQGEYKIGLTAKNFDESLVAKKTLTINTVKPAVLFYKENPLEGVEYQNALDIAGFRSGQDIKIKAEPYYFSKEDLGDLSFEWLVNGAAIQKTGRQNIFSFNSNEGLSGLIPIELTIKNLKNIFQEVSAKFNINVQ